MQIQAALRFVSQRPQSLRLLTIEIELCGVLQAKNDRMGLHALLRLLPMRLQNRMPLDLVVVEEAVRRHRFAPAMTRLRHTGRRVGRHSFHQKPRSLVQARVAQVQLPELRLRPGCRFGDQGVRSKAESKRETPTVYKRCSMSLKVNELSRCRGATATLCITFS